MTVKRSENWQLPAKLYFPDKRLLHQGWMGTWQDGKGEAAEKNVYEMKPGHWRVVQHKARHV
jgi:hypothetical protein